MKQKHASGLMISGQVDPTTGAGGLSVLMLT